MISKTINKRNFEQSIELIYPSKPKNNNKYPLLIYIGGTAWLGYFPIIYRIADFWNKRMIYKLVKDGYSCVIIRYRGKFFNALNKNLMILILFLIYIFNVKYCIFCSIMFIYWKRCEYYSPTIIDMENDVINSIERCLVYNENIIKKEMNTNGKIIFISYSAGSHILLSSLQKINNKLKNNIIKGIIIVSGVLKINTDKDKYNVFINTLSRIVLRTIFKENINTLFCPSKDFKNIDIPLLIIQSKKEFLNIPIVENIGKIFFNYIEFLEKKIKNIEIITLRSNHWLILTNKNVIESIKKFIDKQI
jgi:predicted nucleotidyltransferase